MSELKSKSYIGILLSKISVKSKKKIRISEILAASFLCKSDNFLENKHSSYFIILSPTTNLKITKIMAQCITISTRFVHKK